jgi:hypothetical protein
MKTRDRVRGSATRPSLQEGQAIVLIALMILVLFGMLGLAIDSGRAYVDRRDQQTAVDAAALAAGDWYMNYFDIPNYAAPKSVGIYQNNLHLYGGYASTSHTSTNVGPNANLPQDTYTYNYSAGYTLQLVATNTQFNGYQFVFTSSHTLPLAFIQIFGGSATVSVGATATAIVGNQRSTPALLTLSTGSCATNLQGSATLTVLGDIYTNGTSCINANLHLAGNCYGAAGSNCSTASYWCYNSSPGFIPYAPNPSCNAGDTLGNPYVPAPSLPDPGYTSNSLPYYTTSQSYSINNRGTYTEMLPGSWPAFHLTGGSASCAFLAAGVYQWGAPGYQSDATGSFLSNELKPPDEGLAGSYGTTSMANPQFWNQNGVTCAGDFNLSVVNGLTGTNGIKHQGGTGNWGVELTSVRYDTFPDPNFTPNPCYNSPGCIRESAPSACQQVNTSDTNSSGIAVNITKNAPGAQYYYVYLNPNGCDGIQNNFAFLGRYLAPGWTDGGAPPANPSGPWPNGTNTMLSNGLIGLSCPLATATICNIAYTQLSPTAVCTATAKSSLCRPTDPERAPQCFSNCPPPANTLTQENAQSTLQYTPNTGGDIANENYCQQAPNPGSTTAPCQGSLVTPGAVQFYFPNGSCMTQNAQGATYVFGGRQYNWIVIYSPPANTCANKLNGGSSTQYIGTIYTPGAAWTINGGNRAPLAGQVICYTATVSGSAAVGIDFNPNYGPVPPSARLIN